ncbi:MAG: radical SAM protein [Thermodesulfobacteriota bacterium]
MAEWPVTWTVVSRLNRPVAYLDGPDEVFQAIGGADDPQDYGKHCLWLTRNRGAFVRDCPGTSHYTCCNYEILHIGTYCSMDCAYCILQAYFHPPVLQFFVNHQQMHESIDTLFASETIHRIGTGEFTDSLIWEPVYPIAEELIRRFSAQHSAVLELKTKTANVKSLLGLPHNQKTIMAWSLNTPRVIATQERATAGLDQRIRAAVECRARGYPLAFHFDPLVIYDGCETEYGQVIDRLFDAIDGDAVVWISIGSFRFMPTLKPVIERRFSRSKIVYGEFVKGIDGKMRYFKPLRIALYRSIIEKIREKAPSVLLYFCMEDDEVWQKSLGFCPDAAGGLPRMLDGSAARHCGLQGRFRPH